MRHRIHRIGCSPTLAGVGDRFQGFDLVVVTEPEPRGSWYRASVQTVAQAGVRRIEGTAVVWAAHAAKASALASRCPDPVVVVVCPEPQPLDGPGAAERVAWLDPRSTEHVLVAHAEGREVGVVEVWEFSS